MGIELPAELAGVAEKAGVRWPEADEDRMRESATAWREAARSIESLAGDADTTAQGALRAFRGEAADAAGREWRGFVEEDGLLPVSARRCTAAADRLDDAAQRIGETKVELVRELTALARRTDVAEQAAKAGHPQALAAVDSEIRGATVNLARLHETLATAVGPEPGAVVEAGTRAIGNEKSTVDELARGAEPGAPEAAGRVVGGVQESVGEVAAGAQHAMDGAPPGGAGEVAPTVEESGEAVRDAADPSTGPIPVSGGSGPAGPSPAADPATAPHGVQSAWAAAPGQPAQPPVAQPPQAYGPPPAQQGGYFAAPGGTAGPNAGATGQPPPHAAGPRAPGPGAYGQVGAPVPPGRGATPHRAGPPNQQVQRAPLMPPHNPPQAPSHAPESPQRGLRNGPRNADAVAIVLHQFPIGHLPVASHGASRQLPPPSTGEPRAGLNFPPQDHPESRLVDDADALAGIGSGELYREAQRERRERGDPERLPEDLLAGYDELGELSELEWEQRYTAGGSRAWPPSEQFPEGGHEAGEPVVLEPETELDLLGDGAGRIFHAAGTPFAQRSLPPGHAEREHRSYRVVRPLPVWRSVVAPWFEQPGGGLRYRATCSANDLVGLGWLVELTRGRRIAEASTLRIEMSGDAALSGDDEREVEG
ncbi:glycohydrolase toxin TNT-related protein [Saccharopolyspora griseoalba]|uniref:Glycohydrolase toxin TNT-related protein n=1 Tax=Saccharopolyspora griseoalba TaxID=1431848 RepID=A0ABW2LIU9_9PSEU